jgi:hypothetical protein
MIVIFYLDRENSKKKPPKSSFLIVIVDCVFLNQTSSVNDSLVEKDGMELG